jgi:WD40 repeat protein
MSVRSRLARSSRPGASLDRVLGSLRYRTPYAIETLRVSPCGRWILASLAGPDGRHWLFDARTGAVRKRIEAVDVAFDRRAAGDYFVLRGDELQRWSATLGHQIDTVMRCADVWGANIDPYGRGLVVGAKGFVRRDGTTLALDGLGDQPRGAFTRHEFVCATAGAGFARYSLEDGARVAIESVYARDDNDYIIAISPDESRVAVRTSAGLSLVDLEANKTRSFYDLGFDDRGRWSNPLALSDDRCAVSTPEGFTLIHRQTGRRRVTIRTPKAVAQLAFSPEKDGLLWCSRNDDLRYSPDGDCLLAWNPEKRVRVLPADRGHVDRVDGVASATIAGRETVFTTACDGTVKRWPLDERGPRAVDCVSVVPTERLEVSGGVLCVSESECDGAGGFARFAAVDEERSDDTALRDLRREFYRDRDAGKFVFATGECARLSADGGRVARVLGGYSDGGQRVARVTVEPVREGGEGVELGVVSTRGDDRLAGIEWLDARRLMVLMAHTADVFDVDAAKLVQRYEHPEWRAGTVAAPLSDRECLRFDWNGNLDRLDLARDLVVASVERTVPYRYPLVIPTLILSPDRSLALVNSRAGAHVYRTDTLRRVARLRFAKNAGPLCAAAFTADNTRVIVGCKRGVALVYTLSTR